MPASRKNQLTTKPVDAPTTDAPQNDASPRSSELLAVLASQVGTPGPVPVYLQLRQSLAHAIQQGRLRPGESLPAVRAMAAALGLAPNTVAKTYALLQDDGLTENRAGAGTRVRADSAAGQRSGLLELRRCLQELKAAGVSSDELRAFVEEVLGSEPSISVRGTQLAGTLG